ncbi:uncharacterized protein LOC132713240 [Ruditapes philippinarum]|uniref:uncharacterized protein LOC132713240 n=1 Tax=Ruditapes philippinarum TaxID=129788 RepID=UPI00295B3C3D|nr:uncharacterized protein LOC132713240 [Ruditapes philippinarum]
MEVFYGVSLLVFLTLTSLLQGTVAIQCYSCDNFDTSEDCMNITDCGNNEVCYARADGTSTGNVKYTVGCTRDMSAQREDPTFCANVCMDNLCNLDHCNIPSA